MTNSDRWRVIAEAFDTPPEMRSERQREMTGCGLCYAWRVVTGGDMARYDDLSEFGMCGFYRENDEWRATLAGLLAAMTERERRALWREAGEITCGGDAIRMFRIDTRGAK